MLLKFIVIIAGLLVVFRHYILTYYLFFGV